MALLNEHDYCYILTFNNVNGDMPDPIHKYNTWPGIDVRPWHDRDYWYVEFVNSDAFYHYPIESIVPAAVLQKIINKEVILCISNIHEAYHNVIDNIYQDVFIKSKIPPESVLYLTNSADIAKEIDFISKKYNLPAMESEFISLFEMVAKGSVSKNPMLFAKDTLNKISYTKKFISLNGLWRPHRQVLVTFLEALRVRENGYVSFNAVPGTYPDMSFMYPILLEWYEHNDEAIKLISDNREILMKLDRFLLDTDLNASWAGAVNESTDKKYYEDTYFSVVTETLCFRNASNAGAYLGRAVSEKTFKPIIHRHPFLLVAVAGSLELLRKLGYKTFSPWIDELYDTEPDDYKRALMIAKETARLTNLTGSELTEFLEACKPIVEYNFQLLLSKTRFNYSII